MRDEHPKTSHPIPECIVFPLFVKGSMAPFVQPQFGAMGWNEVKSRCPHRDEGL